MAISSMGWRQGKLTWKGEFKPPWREAGPPNHHDDKEELSLYYGRDDRAAERYPRGIPQGSHRRQEPPGALHTDWYVITKQNRSEEGSC